MLSRIAAHAMSYMSAMRPQALAAAPEPIDAATKPHELPSTEVSSKHLYPLHFYSLPTPLCPTHPVQPASASRVTSHRTAGPTPLDVQRQHFVADLSRCSPRAQDQRYAREVWTSVAGLSARDELLNLRAAPATLSRPSDDPVATPAVWTTTWTLKPDDDLHTFLESGPFDHVTTMRIAHPDPSCLVIFIGHVEAHPREDMMLHLIYGATLNVVTAARICALRLAGVRVDYGAGHADPEILTVLRHCPFPIELRGCFSPDALSIASQISTLRRLEVTEEGQHTSEHILPEIARHPFLEQLRFGSLEFSRLRNETTWTLRDSGGGGGGGGEYDDDSASPLSAREHRSKL